MVPALNSIKISHRAIKNGSPNSFCLSSHVDAVHLVDTNHIMTQALPLLIWVTATFLVGLLTAYIVQGSINLRNIANSIFGELLLFVYMIGIPFATLILGVVGQDLVGLGHSRPNTILGFANIEWIGGVARAGVASLSVCALLWLKGREQTKSTNLPPLLLSMRDTLYDTVHAVFYFGAGTLVFNDAYWGVLAGIALTLLEWALHPRFASRLSTQHGRQRLLIRCLCLFTSGLLYAGPQNLWLMLLADAVIRMLGPRLLQPALV